MVLYGGVPLRGVTGKKEMQGTETLGMPPGQGSDGTLISRSGGGRLSKCSELTVDDSEPLGGTNGVYSDSRIRGTKVGDD